MFGGGLKKKRTARKILHLHGNVLLLLDHGHVPSGETEELQRDDAGQPPVRKDGPLLRQPQIVHARARLLEDNLEKPFKSARADSLAWPTKQNCAEICHCPCTAAPNPAAMFANMRRLRQPLVVGSAGHRMCNSKVGQSCRSRGKVSDSDRADLLP